MSILLVCGCGRSGPQVVAGDGLNAGRQTAVDIGANGAPTGDGLPEGGVLESGVSDPFDERLDPMEYEEWDIVDFTDPRDQSTYEIIDGRVTIVFCERPQYPEMDPNYFDVERPANDPYYTSVTTVSISANQQYQSFIASENLLVVNEWDEIGSIGALLPPGQSVADAVANWPSEYSGLIDVVEPDAIMHTQSLSTKSASSISWPEIDPNDGKFRVPLIGGHNGQWNLRRSSEFSIEIQDAWYDENYGYGNDVIAVLDTGVDYHPTLLEDLVKNSTPTGCNTGDRLSSTRFGTRESGGGQPWSFLMNRGPLHSMYLGHGTCVASIISAHIDNESGSTQEDRSVAGIAHNNKYYPIAIKASCDNEGAHYSRWAVQNAYRAMGCVKGIYDKRQHFPGKWLPYYRVEVANVSFGNYSYSKAIDLHLNTLGRYILFVGAAGNDGKQVSMFPACHPNVMSVAAYDILGARSIWGVGYSSNWGSSVDIAAPGSKIWATDMYDLPSFPYQRGYIDGACYQFRGTSAAAPHVSAVAALATTKWPSAWPCMIRQRIIDCREITWDNPNNDPATYPDFLKNHGKLDAKATLSDS